MWVACLLSLLAAALSIYLFFTLYLEHHHFAKNAVLVQGKVTDMQPAACSKKLRGVQRVPVVEYAFQGKRWRYCADLDTVKSDMYLGRRLNLRVLHDRPTVVRSDLELIQRDGWVMAFAITACFFGALAAFLFHPDSWQQEFHWIIGVTLAGLAWYVFKYVRRWYQGHYLRTSLTEDNAHPIDEILASKVSSQS